MAHTTPVHINNLKNQIFLIEIEGLLGLWRTERSSERDENPMLPPFEKWDHQSPFSPIFCLCVLSQKKKGILLFVFLVVYLRLRRNTAATAATTMMTAAAAAIMYMSVDGAASGGGATEGEAVGATVG